MSMDRDHLVVWIPRVLGIAFAAFLALFALDVFGEPLAPLQKALALAIHLIPTWLVLAVVALAWRREWWGTLLYPALSLAHVAMSWRRFDWTAYVALDAPLVLLALMCWLVWQRRRRAAAARG